MTCEMCLLLPHLFELFTVRMWERVDSHPPWINDTIPCTAYRQTAVTHMTVITALFSSQRPFVRAIPRKLCDRIHKSSPLSLSFVRQLPLKIALECETVQRENSQSAANMNWQNCPDQMSWACCWMTGCLCWAWIALGRVTLHWTCGQVESYIHDQMSKFKMFSKNLGIFSASIS